MNKFQWVLVASGLGLVGGIYLGNTQKHLPLIFGIGSSGTLFGGGLAAAFYQKKTNRLTNTLEKRIENLILERDGFKKEFENLQRIHLETSSLKDKALSEVENLKTKLELVDNSLKDYQWRGGKDKDEIIALKETVLKLNHKIEKLQDVVSDKEAELEEFNKDYQENLDRDVELAFEKRKAEVIEKEIAIDEEITTEAIELINDYKAFVEGIMDRHAHNRELLLDTNQKAKEHIANIVNSKNQAYEDLQQEKQQLELQKQMLQQQLDGELIAPEKTKGMAGWNWTIANMLVDHMWEQCDIPLKITGVDETLPDGSAVVAFAFSKSANPEKIINILNANGKQWAKVRGIYYIGNARLSPRFPAIEVTIRRDKPAQDSTESIYKQGLIPAKLFGETIFKAMTHGNKGKPTLRVMAATGDGKGIATKNLLAYFLTLQENWDIWLSDPVSGSDEDYWDCEKVAINRTEARVAYDKFYEVYQGRKAKLLSTTPKLLGVFDEFDSEHSEEQHEKAQEIMGRIRHVGMHQILVGQSAEVGRNGWTWDGMKNCALLVLEGSIGSLRKHLTTDLGWTLKQKNQLGKEYDKYRKWADAENEANPDRPVENQTRIGLLIIGDRYQFLEIPIAHKGILRGTSAVTVRTEIGDSQIENKLSNQDNDSYKGNLSAKKGILESNDDLSMVTCPHCNSVNVGKQGFNSKGQQYYSCKDCNHKPKKWLY